MVLLFAPFYPQCWAHYGMTSALYGLPRTSGISWIFETSLDFLEKLEFCYTVWVTSSSNTTSPSYHWHDACYYQLCLQDGSFFLTFCLANPYISCPARRSLYLLWSARRILISYVLRWTLMSHVSRRTLISLWSVEPCTDSPPLLVFSCPRGLDHLFEVSSPLEVLTPSPRQYLARLASSWPNLFPSFIGSRKSLPLCFTGLSLPTWHSLALGTL